MATSNIKLFDENKGNMLNDTEFNISTQRLNGLQTGVASSQLQNKAMYQASLVAYAIAQIMLQNGLNANDTDAVSAFVANLSGTLLQKVHDIATTEEAKAGVATGKWMSPALVKAAIDALAAKAQNVLSDATKATVGLESTATPDDAFNLVYNTALKMASKDSGYGDENQETTVSGSIALGGSVGTINIPVPENAKLVYFAITNITGAGGGGGSAYYPTYTAKVELVLNDARYLLGEKTGIKERDPTTAINLVKAVHFNTTALVGRPILSTDNAKIVVTTILEQSGSWENNYRLNGATVNARYI